MRRRWALVLALASATAHADATKPITLHIQGGQLYDVARQLGAATGCQILGMATQKLDLVVDKLSLWDVLTKLEVENNVYANISGGTIILDTKPGPHPISWANDWQRHGMWAVAYVPGRIGGFSLQTSHTPPPDEHRGRLWLLGLDDYVVDRVIVDHATAGKTKLKVVTGDIRNTMRRCGETAIELTFDSSLTSGHASIGGQIVVKIPKTVERRVSVPTNDDVVDLAEGRLRIHIASREHGTGQREIHVGWDGMGERRNVTVEIVDETGVAIPTLGRGSGSGNSQGSEDRTIAWTGGKVFARLQIPSGAFTEDKVPFRFDHVPLEPAP